MIDFARLLGALSAQRVEYILIGGAAAIAHGSSRFTQDLHIVYQRGPENLERLVNALSPHAPYLRVAPPGLPFNLDLATLKSGLSFTLTTKLGHADLL